MRRSSRTTPLPGLRRLPAVLALAVAFTGLAVAPSSASTDCTAYWTGAASVDTYNDQWSTAGNWSADAAGAEPHDVPGASDVVCTATSAVSNPRIYGYDVDVAAVHFPATDVSVAYGTLSTAPDSVSQIQRVSAGIDGYVVAGARSTMDLYGILYVSKGGLIAEQDATIHSHAYASIGGSFRGHVVLDGDTTISYANITADGLVNNGTMNLDTWQFGGNLIGRFPDQTTPSIINNGTINVSTSRTDVAVDGVDNRGTLAVAGGRIPVTGLANLSDGTLSGPGAFVARTPPTYYPPSELVFETPVTTNAATLRLASGGSFGTSLENLVANSGTLDVGASLAVGTDLVNTGTVNVGAQLTAPGYHQTVGSIDGNGGVLVGNATIDGGSISGQLEVQGDLALGSAATTKVVIHGPASSDYVRVDGALSIAGTLQVETDPTYDPAAYDYYDALPADGTSTGTFDAVEGDLSSVYYNPLYRGGVLLMAEPQPAYSVTADAMTVSESDGSATFTVSRSSYRDVPMTVEWEARDGSARAGDDYTAAHGTVTFGFGHLSETVTVPVLGNDFPESSRDFSVVLSNPVHGRIDGDHAEAPVTITDDDPVLSSVSGGPVVQGATNQLLTLDGAHLDGLVDVTFGRAGVSLVPGSLHDAGGGSWTARVKAASTMRTGPISVKVVTAYGEASCTDCLTVVSRPVATSTTPGVLGAGASHRSVTVRGTGFVDGAAVTIAGAVVHATSFVSPSELRVTVSVPATRAPGAASLRVTNPDGGSSVCRTCARFVAAPTLDGTNAMAVRRGTERTVHLTGTGFAEGLTLTGPTGVTFTDLVVSPTEVTATMAVAGTTPIASGRRITVTNPASAGWGTVFGNILTVCTKTASSCG